MAPRCPDWGVELAETEHETTDSGDGIRIETEGGIPGDRFQFEGEYLTSYICPNWGLVRFYADG